MKISIDKKNIGRIGRKYGLRFVILHGSAVNGLFRPDSDIDIAILGKKDISFETILKIHGEVSYLLKNIKDHDLDLKTLNKVDPFFRYEVVRTGVLLYGNPADYEEYKSYALRAYEDAQPLLKLERHLIKKYQRHLNKLAYV